jgi:hypothetical protein
MQPAKSIRPDFFTAIHKGVRSMLFELSLEAARLDTSSLAAVDELAERVERTLSFLEEHAEHEDNHVLPALRTIAPELATRLAADHRALDARHHAITRAAEELAVTPEPSRPVAAADLARMIDELVALHLSHMQREEIEANTALWAALDDEELFAIRGRIVSNIPTERYVEWMKFVLPALSPAERRAMTGVSP